ncbi:hypothetical protein CDV31_017367, partial [Fusarium ambrosium]
MSSSKPQISASSLAPITVISLSCFARICSLPLHPFRERLGISGIESVSKLDAFERNLIAMAIDKLQRP